VMQNENKAQRQKSTCIKTNEWNHRIMRARPRVSLKYPWFGRKPIFEKNQKKYQQRSMREQIMIWWME
jgi:hypothetical protein